MLAWLMQLVSRLNPSRSPVRFSRVLRGPNREPIGSVDLVEVTPEGLSIRGTLTGPGVELLGPHLGGFSIADEVQLRTLDAQFAEDRRLTQLRDDLAKLEPWESAALAGGLEVSPRVAEAVASESRRAGIRSELQAAVPRPDLERVAALAEYSQTARAGHDEHEFAWAAYLAAGGQELTPWRAFQAGIRAAADRLQS